MALPQHDLPGWVESAATLLLGAGAARLLGVWLENRRLAKREYRESLLARVRELETRIEGMFGLISDLRVQVALLEDERNDLREQLGMPRKNGNNDVHDEVPRRADGTSPS